MSITSEVFSEYLWSEYLWDVGELVSLVKPVAYLSISYREEVEGEECRKFG